MQGVMFDVTAQKRSNKESGTSLANAKLQDQSRAGAPRSAVSEPGELLQARLRKTTSVTDVRAVCTAASWLSTGAPLKSRKHRAHTKPSPSGVRGLARVLHSPEDCWGASMPPSCRPRRLDGDALPPSPRAPTRQLHSGVPLTRRRGPGVLYLAHTAPSAFTPENERLAGTVAEHVSLSMANLKLRETLRLQSIRDPLTGLFNRRYMEESLNREISRQWCREPPQPLLRAHDRHRPFQAVQ